MPKPAVPPSACLVGAVQPSALLVGAVSPSAFLVAAVPPSALLVGAVPPSAFLVAAVPPSAPPGGAVSPSVPLARAVSPSVPMFGAGVIVLLLLLAGLAPAAGAQPLEELIQLLDVPDVFVQYDAMELAGAEEYDVFLLAVAHLMNRQLETAAWLFWQDALRRPADAMTLSRLGLVLHEMYVYTGATDPALLDGAIVALRGAAEAAPAEASVLNNLAYALSRRGRPEDLSEAAWLIKRAVELDPEEPLYWVRRALVAQAPDEPDKALESVFVAHAMSPVVTAALDPSRIDGFVEADKPYCEIVCLACDSCPPGIIGELNRITCLMEEQGARLACQAGELFPTSFDCFEGLPDYGILIPGLNAGLSILTPFGELHVSIDGDGVVHWKAGVKFPAGRLEPGAGAAGTRHVGSDRRGHGDPDGPVRQGHRARRQRPGQVPNHRQVRGVGAQRQPVRREAGVGIPRR